MLSSKEQSHEIELSSIRIDSTAISKDCSCNHDSCQGFLLTFCSGLGYDRNDPSTVRRAKLPVLNEKGMILAYGVTHEKFVWDIRGEPGVIEAFEKVYDDKDLIVSFDVVNVGFANREDLLEK